MKQFIGILTHVVEGSDIVYLSHPIFFVWLGKRWFRLASSNSLDTNLFPSESTSETR